MMIRTPSLVALPPAFATMLLLLSSGCFAETVQFRMADGAGAIGAISSTIVEVESGGGLGAFQFNVTYDATVLQPESVEPAGEVNALVDFNVVSPGILRVAFASSSRVADGAIIKINWNVLNGESSRLQITELRAWEQESSFELPVQTTSGEFKVVAAESAVDVNGSDSETPLLNSSPMTIALMVLGVIILAWVLKLALRKPTQT